MLDLPQITTPEEDEEFLRLVAANVRRIREERGISQLETALSIGQATNGYYATMENCARGKRFNLLHLFRLARLFDCDVREFFAPLDDNSNLN